MYSPRRTSYGSPPPELSNNPFIDHPANALTRYPDINGTDEPTGSSQFTSWLNPGGSSTNTNPTGYVGGQPSGFTAGYAQQQQQTGYPTSPAGGYPQQTGYNTGYGAAPVQQAQPTGRPFQPSSSFGQQLATQINGAYGQQPVPQQQQQQQQYSGYPTSPQYGSAYGYPQQQQQQPQQTQYFPEFDPYASQQSSASVQGQQPPAPSPNGYQAPHPRDYVRTNKQDLESWDSYAWKQVCGALFLLLTGVLTEATPGHKLL